MRAHGSIPSAIKRRLEAHDIAGIRPTRSVRLLEVQAGGLEKLSCLPRIAFASIVGVNHHSQAILLGSALISHEDAKTFKWVFSTWLAAMGSRAPNAIMTDQCESMKSTIREVMPNTTHKFCIWHILCEVPEKPRGVQDRRLSTRTHIPRWFHFASAAADAGSIRIGQESDRTASVPPDVPPPPLRGGKLEVVAAAVALGIVGKWFMSGLGSAEVAKALDMSAIIIKEGKRLFASVYLALGLAIFKHSIMVIIIFIHCDESWDWSVECFIDIGVKFRDEKCLTMSFACLIKCFKKLKRKQRLHTEMQNISFLEFQYKLSRSKLLRRPSRLFSSRDRQSSSTSRTSTPPTLQPNLSEMRQVFNKFDSNKDGKISQQEYKATLRALGQENMIGEVPKIFQVVDMDGDGFIDFTEFVEAQKKGGGIKTTDIQGAFQAFDVNGDGK
ncbi:hypothetical protein GH714_035312 [Hevea brasiliensis]|uniref:EF-hand domain-containing protein n=1 Tax=Hevea brasiliensis TaxID=3981 RepID=A0A6A6N8M2_HEVBR|nr:hypothetical protein GH714_035312 [Hevea brasiliensis]